jgi:hypothetical protein
LVRVFINLRGRENIFPDKAKQTLREFQQMTGAAADQPATHIGKRVSLTLRSNKK